MSTTDSATIAYRLGAYEPRVQERLAQWGEGDFAERLWDRDPTLWAEEDTPEIAGRLGWLGLPEAMQAEAEKIEAFAAEVAPRFDDVVVLGMGGSSLAADVFGRAFEPAEGYPALQVLDSTHPEAVLNLEERLDLSSTLFVVASKSGTTAETLSFFRFFWNRVSKATGAPGGRFVAVTDPGTPLADLAEERGFRRVFEAPPDVGGRYSALTPFGLVPAALMGLDLSALLGRARSAQAASAFCVEAPENAGLRLGAALGELAAGGRDKLTLLASESLSAFPAWLEQLVAESTGKGGEGIVPVEGEPLAGPDAYGADRAFACFELEGEEDQKRAEALEALEAAGHPTVRVRLEDRYDLAREMYRWEMGVAAAGAALGVHPFNQPNVEAAKRLAEEAMQSEGQEAMQSEGGQSEGGQSEGGAGTGGDQVRTLSSEDESTLRAALADRLARTDDTGYVAVQAYLPPTDRVEEALRALQETIRDATGLATTLGYGPRFLHSTGQLHKGGPPGGLFLQLVDAPQVAASVPETSYTFRELIAAQATGDFRALQEAGRTVLRVRVAPANLDRLADVIDRR